MNATAPQPTPTRTVSLAETLTVQTEPLLADEWVGMLNDEGALVSVIAIDHDEFESAAEAGRVTELFAATQAAHTAPYWMSWRIVGADDNDVFVRVSNDLREWATDLDNVDMYNDSVGPVYRLTEERLARLAELGKALGAS